MEYNMKIKEVKKTKITATRIKNSLFKKNKELISLKKERSKLIFSQEERKKISLKESSVESSKSFLQSVKNVGKTLVSGPLSLIDKFKEFFGLILLGIVVNNLPAIIQKLQDIFVNIQSFFDQNPWIMNAIKFGFKMIGDGIMGLAKFIRLIGPYIGGSFKFALDTLRSARVQVESLISTFDDLNLSFGKLANDLNIDKIPDSTKDPSRYSNFIAGGGKKALEEKGLSVDEVVDQGKKNISRYDSGPRTPQSNPEPEKPTQKLARGGTVGNIPPEEGTFRGGPSDIAKNKNDSSKKRSMASPFTKTESGNARKARESVNYFETFNRTLNDAKENTILEKKNIESFEEMANNFKQFSELMEKLSTFNPNPPPTPPGSNELIEIDGKTYTAEGGETPSQYMSSEFGPRKAPVPGASTYHQGVDFAHPVDNIPVSVIKSGTVLHAGSTGGLGNYVEIKHDDGVITGYGHLSSIKVRKDQVISPGTVIGNQGNTGISGGPHVHFTYKPPGGQLSNGLNFANSYFRFGGNVKLKEVSFAGGNNEQKTWNFFKSLGLNDAIVAGIMGNAQQESGFRPDAKNGNPSNPNFVGIFQWDNNRSGDRWGNLKRWAKSKKLDPFKLETQLQFTWHELNNSEISAFNLLKKAKTPEEAAQIWYEEYERASHGLTERKSYAKNFYKKYKGKSPGNPIQPPTTGTPRPGTGTPPPAPVLPPPNQRASLSSISGGDIALTDLRGKESIGQDTNSTNIVFVPIVKRENIVTPIPV